jgi:hypothetical protein
MMEAVTSVNLYQSTGRYNPEDSHLNTRHVYKVKVKFSLALDQASRQENVCGSGGKAPCNLNLDRFNSGGPRVGLNVVALKKIML